MANILITRPIDTAQKTAEFLEGHRAFIAPMLNVRALDFTIPDLEFYGYIVTSARSFDYLPETLDKSKPLFAVGQVTALRAKAWGFTHIVQGGGSGLALTTDILRETPKGATLVHFGGADLTDSFYKLLDPIDIQRCSVYKMERTKTLPDDVVDALNNGTVDTALFYSKRSVQNFNDLCVNYNLEKRLKNATAICISEHVALCLKTDMWSAVKISDAKTEISMLSLI